MSVETVTIKQTWNNNILNINIHLIYVVPDISLFDVTPVVELPIVDVCPDLSVEVTPPELPVLSRLVTTGKKINTIVRFDLDEDDDIPHVHAASGKCNACTHLLHCIQPTPETYGPQSFLKIYLYIIY